MKKIILSFLIAFTALAVSFSRVAPKVNAETLDSEEYLLAVEKDDDIIAGTTFLLPLGTDLKFGYPDDASMSYVYIQFMFGTYGGNSSSELYGVTPNIVPDLVNNDSLYFLDGNFAMITIDKDFTFGDVAFSPNMKVMEVGDGVKKINSELLTEAKVGDSVVGTKFKLFKTTDANISFDSGHEIIIQINDGYELAIANVSPPGPIYGEKAILNNFSHGFGVEFLDGYFFDTEITSETKVSKVAGPCYKVIEDSTPGNNGTEDPIPGESETPGTESNPPQITITDKPWNENAADWVNENLGLTITGSAITGLVIILVISMIFKRK